MVTHCMVCAVVCIESLCGLVGVVGGGSVRCVGVVGVRCVGVMLCMSA